MKSMISVTQERSISATPDAVWYVISTPEMHERLDSRCQLESATGDGDVGSEYVLVVRAGLARARLRYVVREAIPEAMWVAEVDRGGKEAGVQHAQLVRERRVGRKYRQRVRGRMHRQHDQSSLGIRG